MINAGLPMATPYMAGISNIIGGLPADPNETALQQYIQQLAAQGKTGTPEYLMAGGELQHRQNMREEKQAQQAAGVQQQPPVMQQLAQAPQPQMPPQMQQQQQPMPNIPTMPNPAQSMQDQLGATPQIQPGIMNASQAGGIETLPAENLNNIENYAGGGIVAFDEGGEVPGYGFGGIVKAILAAQPEQDTASQTALRNRIRGLYDQGQTTLPADFFTSEEGGGIRGKFKRFLNNTVKKDLAQKELDSMWADKSKADLAAFFNGPGGVQRRLSAEDVEKYGLAGGGVVAFEGGGPTSPFGRFIESAKKSGAEESELLSLQEALANQYRSAANIPGLFMSQTDAQRQQAKDIMNNLTSMKPAEMRSLLAAGKAPEKSVAATTAAKAAQSLDADYPSEGKRGSATLTTPSGTLPGHRFDTLPSTKKQEEKPAPDKVDAGLAALASRLKPMKEPTLDEVGTERAEYYKKLGIPENPYADALKKAQAKAGPEQDEKDRKRMFWETVGAIGSGLGEATSRQTNKRAQFLEDASRGLKRGLEKAPEGLRELEKRKESRDKAIDDLQLAQVNYLKSGADSDLKRVDDKATRAANYNADVLKSQITLEVARLQNSGLITEREAKRETDRRTSAITLATDALKKSSLTIPVGSPEYDAELRKLTAYFYGTLKEGSFGASGAGGALQQTGKGSFDYVPKK